MEIKSTSLTSLYEKNPKKKSNSLPNLHTSSTEGCASCSPCSKPLTPSSASVKVIPALLQKTWNKIKSMNKKRSTSSSAPTTPISFQKFDFEQEPEEPDPVQENYARLQKRLSEELHQGQIQLKSSCNNSNKSKYCVSEEFRKKLQQWEMWKVSCGKVTYTDEELKLILPEDFSRKLKEWESIRSGSPCATTNAKIEKQIQWLERQLEKVELEKGKLELQMRKYLEKEARLEKMREALKNYPREQVLIKTPTAEGFAAGVDEKFTKKLYEWEEMRGIPAEDGSMALLNPKYYHQVGGSSNSSEPPETEDIQETSHDEPEPNTPDTSSSLESINQASGSNTSSADFYQKSRRRSSDAVSTPLSARSPSLSAFTSDDEDNAGLLKTVQEEETEEKLETPSNPVVRANQIVVEEEDAEQYFFGGVFVPTKRTIFKPIESESSGTPELNDLRSPNLVRSASATTAHTNYSAPPTSLSDSGGRETPSPGTQSPGTYSPGTSPSSPTKLRAEDIWNKNIDASPPPVRDAPKVVGFIPKLPPLPFPPSPSSPRRGNSGSSTSGGSSYPGFTSCYIQKPVFQHDGLKNFPRMGKAPVWVSPLVARRKMNSMATSTSFRDVSEYNKGSCNRSEFSLDRFLESSNLASSMSSTASTSKYTIGGGIPPTESVRLISLSRSSSFGVGKLQETVEPPVQEPVAKVCKSKSASSILKSSLNLFSKVRRSETLSSNNNEPVQHVKTTRARWFLNKF